MKEAKPQYWRNFLTKRQRRGTTAKHLAGVEAHKIEAALLLLKNRAFMKIPSMKQELTNFLNFRNLEKKSYKNKPQLKNVDFF